MGTLNHISVVYTGMHYAGRESHAMIAERTVASRSYEDRQATDRGTPVASSITRARTPPSSCQAVMTITNASCLVPGAAGLLISTHTAAAPSPRCCGHVCIKHRS